MTALDSNIILPTEDRKREPKKKERQRNKSSYPQFLSCFAALLFWVSVSLGFLLLAVTALDPNIILPTEDRKREPKKKKDKETNQATP